MSNHRPAVAFTLAIIALSLLACPSPAQAQRRMVRIRIHVTVVKCPPRPANVNRITAAKDAMNHLIPGQYSVTLCTGSPHAFTFGGGPAHIRIVQRVRRNGEELPPPVVTGHEHGTNGIDLRPGTHTGSADIDADVSFDD